MLGRLRTTNNKSKEAHIHVHRGPPANWLKRRTKLKPKRALMLKRQRGDSWWGGRVPYRADTAMTIKYLQRTLWGPKLASSITLPPQQTMNGPGHMADLDSSFICPEKWPRMWLRTPHIASSGSFGVCSGVGSGWGTLTSDTKEALIPKSDCQAVLPRTSENLF